MKHTEKSSIQTDHAYDLARIVAVLDEFDGNPELSRSAARVIDAVRCVIPDWAIDQPLSAFDAATEAQVVTTTQASKAALDKALDDFAMHAHVAIEFSNYIDKEPVYAAIDSHVAASMAEHAG